MTAQASSAIRSLRRAWRRVASAEDPGLGFAAIRDHLIAAAWQDMRFDTLALILTRLLDQAPFLRQLGYEWTTRREAYDFPAEALDQFRALQTIAGLHGLAGIDPANLQQIAVRETSRWHGARARPKALAENGWRLIVSPFGWDNHLQLMLRALAAHSRVSELPHPIFRDAATVDWRPLVKGLVINAGIGTPASVPADSVITRAAIDADPWFEEAVVSMADFLGDGLTRSLAALAADFAIAHETAHHVLHHGFAGPRDTIVERQADRAALIACWRWDFARDLTALPSRRSNYWDFVSALLCLTAVITGAVVERCLTGTPAPEVADELAARTSALLDLAYLDSSITGLTSIDIEQVLALTRAINAFTSDLSDLVTTMPLSASAALAEAARDEPSRFVALLGQHLRGEDQ